MKRSTRRRVRAGSGWALVALLAIVALAVGLRGFPSGEVQVPTESRTLAAEAAGWPAGTRALPAGLDRARIEEINRTLDRIESGGPFPYERDGATFYNREGRLPPDSYREYTVRTPQASNRGARRLVVAVPSGLAWYSDDHYETFVLIARVRWPEGEGSQ